MKEETSTSISPKESQKRPVLSAWIRKLGIAVLTLSILSILGVFPSFLVEIPIWLAAGWILFLGRVGPQISWNLAAITGGLIMLFAAGTGFHYLVRSFSPGWKKSWTVAWIGLGIVLFAASIFTTGIVHQTAWMTRESFLDSARSTTVKNVSNLRQILIGLLIYRAETGKLPNRIYDLFPGYLEIPPEETQLWAFPNPNGIGELEYSYFPEAIKLASTAAEGNEGEKLIVLASPVSRNRRIVGFLDGGVSLMKEKDFRKRIAEQYGKLLHPDRR